MGNIVDRLIGWVSPQRGLQRHFARQRLQRAHEAAAPGDRWRPRRAGASANADHVADAAILRAKARSLVQNVPYIEAGLTALVAATIGDGVVPRATGAQADKINRLIKQWSPVADADGRLDLPGLIVQAYRTMEQDGEVLIRLRPRLQSDGLPVPLQLQVLEIDWIDSTRTGPVPGNSNNRLVNGIEYDMLGRVAAYWLFDSHPGDVSVMRTMRTQSRRVDAASIIHLFNPKRPGQGRGFTRLASVIARVRDLQTYEDAEIARKNLESRLGVLVSGDPSLMANPASDGSQPNVEAGDLGELSSGGITRLPAGSNIETLEPAAAGGHVDYVKLQLHIIATGMGVTYEMLTGDMSEVNFSSARVRRMDMRRGVTQMQWLTLKPMLLDRIHRAVVDAAFDAGKLTARDYTCDASFPRWEMVDPAKEIEADTAEMAAGLSSLSEKLRQRGYDPKTVLAEIASDIEEMRRLNILDVLLFKETKKPADGASPTVAAAATQRALDTIAELLQRMDTRLLSVEQRATHVDVRGGDTHVSVPERSVTVQPPQQIINVEPARVVNEIRNEGAVVHVPAQPAPEVRVVNEVAAPEVHVTNEVPVPGVTVNVPARQTITEIERDADKRIKRTVTNERPLPGGK